MREPTPTARLPFADPDEGACYVGVALDLPVDRLFTYRVPGPLAARARAGQRVVVRFRGRRRLGLVVERQEGSPLDRVLEIEDLPDEEPLLDGALLQVGRFVARHYGAAIGEALAAMLPRGVRTRGRGRRLVRVRLAEAPGTDGPAPDRAGSAAGRPGGPAATAGEDEGATGPHARVLRWLGRHPEGMLLADLCRRARVSTSPVRTLARRGLVRLAPERSSGADELEAAVRLPAPRQPPPALTPEQAPAVLQLEAAVQTGTFAPFLLLGVTGSGKTEVYLRAIQAAVARGRQAIVLVPEIALTPQTVRRFRERFERVALLHSAMTDAARARAWRRIRRGEADVVIGPRSAVFAPVPRLGLLVVDEEHEGSFKQQSAPRYHARDVGLVRARAAGAVVILGSATPSLESWHHAREGRYALLRLSRRVHDRPLPGVQVVDLGRPEERRSAAPLSRTLLVRLGETLGEGGQAILLRNRRGFATSVACARCGWVVRCRACDVGLTWHRADQVALCHLCGHEEVPPRTCPDCALPGLKMRGAGTQTVEAAVREAFPTARVARMDSDTMATREAYEDVLGRFGRQELDVLVGTQMIAKGLHFPAVTLVGIVSADAALALPDFRSAERTFSLLAQVAGRAGRGEGLGRVVVQALMPDHPAVVLAATHDYEAFAARELEDRRAHGYPPFSRLLRVLVRGPDEAAVAARAEATGHVLSRAAPPGTSVLGPAVPAIARIQGRHRRHILVKAPRPSVVARLVALLRQAPRPPREVEEVLDVDPHDLL